MKLKLFGRVRVDEAVDLARSISTKKHNEQVKKNRDILMRLIVAALYLARQEQAFRVHNEASNSSNKGNFTELVHAFAEFDSTLAEHLGSSTVSSGMSDTIQNEIIESIAQIIQDETYKDINKCPFIAVQVDDISDISNKRQFTVVVRYANEKGSVCERFLGFFDVSSLTDAKAITSVVMGAISNYSPAEKLICQTFDGASCMSEQHGDVPALVKIRCPNALFIHCYAHKLNLILAQGTSNIPAAKLFFAGVDAFYSFFSRSCERSAFLCEVDQAVRGPGGSVVRWNFKNRAVQVIHEGRASLSAAFDRMMAEPGWDKDTVAQSAALKQKLEDFDFVFLLGVFQSIFGLTEPLFQVLQSETVDIKKCQDWINCTVSALEAIKKEKIFSGIYDETVLAVGEPGQPRKRRRRDWEAPEQGLIQHQGEEDTYSSFQRIYFQIIDNIVSHMTQRFADIEHLSFFQLMDHTSFPTFCKSVSFPCSELAQLIETYPFFDEHKLRNELHTLYNNRLFHKPPAELLQLLIEDELQGTLSEVCKLLQLMLTIPATSTSAEPSLSCLKRIKTYLRNTCGQDRNDNLARIFIDSVVVEDLKASGKFYNMVIEHYATVRDRRTEFIFK